MSLSSVAMFKYVACFLCLLLSGGGRRGGILEDDSVALGMAWGMAVGDGDNTGSYEAFVGESERSSAFRSQNIGDYTVDEISSGQSSVDAFKLNENSRMGVAFSSGSMFPTLMLHEVSNYTWTS